jgi:hypothetical protein
MVDLPGLLGDNLAGNPAGWQLACTRQVDDALAAATPPQAAVALAGCAALTCDPATALGLFPTTVTAGYAGRLQRGMPHPPGR